jgi:hypothetical protein
MSYFRDIDAVVSWAIQSFFTPDWVELIVSRCEQDAAPPFEYWCATNHQNSWQMAGMVARGIARWLEQQHEYLQNMALDLLDMDVWSNMDGDNSQFDVACSFIWSNMNAGQWLDRHCVENGPKDPLFRMAMVRVILAIREGWWGDLRDHSWTSLR